MFRQCLKTIKTVTFSVFSNILFLNSQAKIIVNCLFCPQIFFNIYPTRRTVTFLIHLRDEGDKYTYTGCLLKKQVKLLTVVFVIRF